MPLLRIDDSMGLVAELAPGMFAVPLYRGGADVKPNRFGENAGRLFKWPAGALLITEGNRLFSLCQCHSRQKQEKPVRAFPPTPASGPTP
jgi:hypothetical protein